jgi:predicted nucleic acid-binding protein
VTRAVFDCVILLQAAARRTGPAAECLQAVRDGRLKLFLSPDILAGSPGRSAPPQDAPKVPGPHSGGRGRVSGGRGEQRDDALHGTQGLHARPRPQGRTVYIDLAAAIQARYLVSRDKDLLDLMGDDTFRQQFPGLTVIDPVALLRELTLAQPKPNPGQQQEDGGRETGDEAG